MKHGGYDFAVLYMIPKALLVDDALKLPSVTGMTWRRRCFVFREDELLYSSFL